MMGRNPVTIRYLISALCIVMLVWGCDSATQPPAKPKVVRKKIVSQEKQAATVTKKKTVRKAKTETAEKTAKKVLPSEIKVPPVAEVESDKQPLVAQKVETLPSEQKKPAIRPKSDISIPKSDISKIEQPLAIQPPTADGQKPAASDKLIASGPKAAEGLTGIPPVYDPTGKIDPFQPLFQEKPALATKEKRKKRQPQTPLERIDISQLKLVAIILASSGNRAMVEESSGKGYVIKEGTYIGTNSGKVVNIKKETVVVEEEFEDAYGKVATRQREFKLPKPPGEF
jgi:type IV pilus assembly protein PilP